jgi:tripartite-type tricarboxylate transporter receptor subunit TctC
MMLSARVMVGVFSAGMLVLGADVAYSQDKYPSKLIRIVTATPGSNHDWGARLVAQELGPRVGQRVIVENRGSIAVEYVAKEAPPDGYTLLFYGALVWLQPYLSKVSWDPLGDLAPITLAISSPSVLVVHPSLPVKSVKELIALARARPGELNYSAGGGGSTPHIAAEFFKYMANVRIVRVNYKGSGPAMMGLFIGEVQLMFAALGPIMPHIKQGRVKPLAVTTPRRSRLIPDLPAVGEALPGYEAEAVIGFFAPRKTSAAIIKLLNQEIVQSLKSTDPQILFNAGVEVVGSSPEEFAGFIKSEMDRMSQVIRSASFSN